MQLYLKLKALPVMPPIVEHTFREIMRESNLWLIHTARERDQGRYMELDQHNGKQWVLAPFPVSNQCKYFCTIYWDLLVSVLFSVLAPVTFPCNVS